MGQILPLPGNVRKCPEMSGILRKLRWSRACLSPICTIRNSSLTPPDRHGTPWPGHTRTCRSPQSSATSLCGENKPNQLGINAAFHLRRLRDCPVSAIISRQNPCYVKSNSRKGVVMSSELAFMPATKLSQAIREGQVSSVEITQVFLDRIQRLDSQLNSYLALRPSRLCRCPRRR